MRIAVFCLSVALALVATLVALGSLTSCAGTLEPMSSETSDVEFSSPSAQPVPTSTSSVDDTQPLPLAIRFGRSCKQCDGNIKLGLKCTIPARKTCGNGASLSLGDGFCVARLTDSKGYCSGRCKTVSDCKSGYSCTDLGTGSGKMCLK